MTAGERRRNEPDRPARNEAAAGPDPGSVVLEPPETTGAPETRTERSADEQGLTPSVTVTVVNFNGSAFLDDCLDAVEALQGPIAEVIVIDNDSTDDSVERIRRRGQAVRLVEMGSNEGPCTSRNRGLHEARTDWVLQIDSDVILRPDTVTALLPQTRVDGVAAIMPRAVLAHDTSVVHYDGGSMHYVGVMCLDRLLARDEGPPGPPEDVDAVISMALLVDRGAVLEAGGWDEAFFILFEDHDLSYRLRARGYRLRRVPAAAVGHREGTAGISYRPGAPAYPGRRAFLHARNRGYLVLKNYSWPAILLSWPGRCVYATVWLVFAATRGVLGSYLKGRLDLLRLLPRALALRRQLARARVVPDRRLLGCRPLTFSPVIARRGGEDRLERALNRMLSGWWRLVRRWLPGDDP